MASNANTLTVGLDFDTASFTRDLRAATAAMTKFQKAASRTDALLSSLAQGFSSVGDMANRMVKASGKTTDLKRKLAAVTGSANEMNRALHAGAARAGNYGKTVDDLRGAALRTGSGLDALTKSYAAVTSAASSASIAVEDVRRAIEGTIGTGQRMGASNGDKQRVFSAIRQVVGKNTPQIMKTAAGPIGKANTTTFGAAPAAGGAPALASPGKDKPGAVGGQGNAGSATAGQPAANGSSPLGQDDPAYLKSQTLQNKQMVGVLNTDQWRNDKYEFQKSSVDLEMAQLYYEYSLDAEQRLQLIRADGIKNFTEKFSGLITGVLSGQTGIVTGVRSMFASMGKYMLDFFAKWASQKLMMKAIDTIGDLFGFDFGVGVGVGAGAGNAKGSASGPAPGSAGPGASGGVLGQAKPGGVSGPANAGSAPAGQSAANGSSPLGKDDPKYLHDQTLQNKQMFGVLNTDQWRNDKYEFQKSAVDLELSKIYYDYSLDAEQRLQLLRAEGAKSFTTQFSGVITGVLSGQMTLIEGARSMFASMTTFMIDFFAKWISQQLLMKAITGIGSLLGFGISRPSDAGMAALSNTGSKFHVGGIVGYDGTDHGHYPSSLWAGAPKLHSGGLLRGEVPIIAKRGEGVFTPEQMDNADNLLTSALTSGNTSPSIHQEVTVNVSGGAGTSEQNTDLADKIGRQVKAELRGLMTEEMRQQMRPGGLLRGGY
ncbi:hypothetical protein C1S70_29405 (plasmid) [Azospirillum argentinense]|uniref:Phage tail tape measure protein n=1 Tax=Azospirillum argentinense TaxID=2970906 RepID=A0A2K1FS03_9PROT|nr:tape measure protein [Azospirillum argentinense]PNQ95327.1 hypothetical protein C1S70_29405 [Azospirillum argentinense]